ncbi:hypothetical protein B0H19DRAFT_1296169 [Mycena capillaripes]|nr:hypothetical protein B0H19DRAFT_1296169 [Mycena capillaripes]
MTPCHWLIKKSPSAKFLLTRNLAGLTFAFLPFWVDSEALSRASYFLEQSGNAKKRGSYFEPHQTNGLHLSWDKSPKTCTDSSTASVPRGRINSNTSWIQFRDTNNRVPITFGVIVWESHRQFLDYAEPEMVSNIRLQQQGCDIQHTNELLYSGSAEEAIE